MSNNVGSAFFRMLGRLGCNAPHARAADKSARLPGSENSGCACMFSMCSLRSRRLMPLGNFHTCHVSDVS